MRIKAVCEATGLTDRAIRHYIEEALIFPAYTENYMGRKTFDFSESDIQQLKDIAVLRKFGFSLQEIKEMILHPEEITRIILDLQSRKQFEIDNEFMLLVALSHLDAGSICTISQLAEQLSAPVTTTPLPADDERLRFPDLLKKALKGVFRFFIVWLPVVLSVFIVMDSIQIYHYPIYRPLLIVLTVLSLLPSWLLLLMSKVKISSKRSMRVRRVLLVLCVCSIPVSSIFSIGIVTQSETTEFVHYRAFDPDCLANRDTFFQDLFPAWPHYFVSEKQPDGSWDTVYLDAKYLYRNRTAFDYTYDIFAEWPLDEESFCKEVDRVTQLFKANTPAAEEKSRYRDCVAVQKGSYTCLVLYDSYGGDSVFEEVTDSYTYYIFAYDEENLRVRYIYCSSLENGAHQPYYLSLDWQ